MKIALDGQPLLNQNKTGIAYYEDGLLKHLLKEYPQDEYGIDIFTKGRNQEKQKIISDYSVKLKIQECNWFSGKLYRMFTLLLPLPYRWFFREERDITHFCNYVIPFGVRGKKVVTVHDLAFHEYPDTIRWRTMLMLKRNLRCSLKRADAVVTDSEFTRKEILRYYNVPAEKLYVVPCGVDTNIYCRETDAGKLVCVKRKYGISGAYFLYLGTLEPRKNLSGLIRAYKIFRERVKDQKTEIPQMVIAGGKGWMYEQIFQTVKELSLEDKVIFTGYVDEEEKPILMGGALAFCFPSFYEGFGMPPIEAMACGTPVLTSNTSSLAEVTDEAALQVDPYDLEEMAESLERLYNDGGLRNELREKGWERAGKYSWQNAVEALHQTYESIMNLREQ